MTLPKLSQMSRSKQISRSKQMRSSTQLSSRAVASGRFLAADLCGGGLRKIPAVDPKRSGG